MANDYLFQAGVGTVVTEDSDAFTAQVDLSLLSLEEMTEVVPSDTYLCAQALDGTVKRVGMDLVTGDGSLSGSYLY